jgi:hypothetical protein
MPEVQELTPIQELYNSLSAKQPQIKDRGFDGFAEDMKDDGNVTALYESLSSQQPQIKERGIDGFKADMFPGVVSQPIPTPSQPQTYIQKELTDKGLIGNKPEQPLSDQKPVKEEKGFWSTWVGDAMQGFAGTATDVVGNVGALANLPMRSYLNHKSKESGIGDEERKIFIDTFLQTNPSTSLSEGLKISAKAEAKKLFV